MLNIQINSRIMLIPPLPQVVATELEAMVSYKHRKYLRGKEAWAKLGQASGNEIVRKTFFTQENGFIAIPAGFMDMVSKLLYRFELPHQFTFAGFSEAVPNWNNLSTDTKFRYPQLDHLQEILRYPFGGLDAAPGYGKSFIISIMCQLFRDYRVDITTESVEVCRTLEEYLVSELGRDSVGFVGDGTNKPKQITIYTTGSIHKSDGDADVLLVDEVHEVVTEKACPKFSVYKKARRYWFSANPWDRADNSSIRVEALFGKTRAEFPFKKCVEHGLVANIEVNYLPFFMDFDPLENETDPTKMARFGIWRNEKRNAFIAEYCKKEIPADDQTLILVQSVEHLAHLAKFLPEYQVAFGAGDSTLKEAGYWASQKFIPEDSCEDRKIKNQNLRVAFSKNQLKKVIVTSIWDTGVNFPDLAGVFRTDPFAAGVIKDTQAPGRTSRIIKSDGTIKEMGRLYTLLDMFNKPLYSKEQRQRTNYRSQGWEEVGWLSWERQ